MAESAQRAGTNEEIRFLIYEKLRARLLNNEDIKCHISTAYRSMSEASGLLFKKVRSALEHL